MRNLRIVERSNTIKLRLLASFDGSDLGDLSPSTRAVHLQVSRPDTDPELCATIDAGALRATRRSLRFRDRTAAVPNADGVRLVRLRLGRQDRAKLKAVARQVGAVLPPAGPVSIVAAFESTDGTNGPVRCLTATGQLETTRRGLRLQ